MNDEEKENLAAVLEDAAAAHESEHENESCPISRTVRRAADGLRASLTTSGPAQVATESYRKHWEGCFGKKQEVGQA